jgi:hypothetical protein
MIVISNQMLDRKTQLYRIYPFISHDASLIDKRDIVVKLQHCYGCTAGAGSSCGGGIVAE